ncbi:MAG: glycosyltransferase family 4 protein [Bacteroidia bacterium]|nr:glycosyltransferase family 4 protein [Bacteroidia bacterium]MDW8301146.1 glycosyltransferase family 4 protein [Bacteroidia bacterium]
MSKKITYIISNIDKALVFEWTAEALQNTNFELSFILLNPKESTLENYLASKNIRVKRIHLRTKKDIPFALLKTYLTLKKWKPDVVHCHLFEASLVGLFAAKLASIPKRVYTRHHFLYHWEENPKAVKYDVWCNQWATHIVVLTQRMGEFLIENENAVSEKIRFIPHGFRFETWQQVDFQKTKILKSKYNCDNQYPVIGVIARWVKEKGVEYIIPAFKKILQDYPNAKLLLANARGIYKPRIQALLQDIPQKNYQVIEFEPDIANLYALFDIYVHVPTGPDKEPFGQTYIEALFAQKPCIFTLSGIAHSFIEHEKNALVVPYCDSEAIYQSCIRLLNEPELAKNLALNGYDTVTKLFSLEQMIEKLKSLYAE